MKKIFTILLLTSVFISGCVLFQQKQDVIPLEEGIQKDQGSQEIDTSDWKTYRNEEYGFEFKYPGDYLLKEIDQGVYLEHSSYSLIPNVPAEGGVISVIVSDKTIEKHIQDVQNIDPPLSRVINQRMYTLDGINGIEVVSNSAIGIEMYDIFISYNASKYIISYNGIGLSSSREIISTLRFMD